MLLRVVRHGETDWNRRGIVQGSFDVPLNARGKVQASKAGERLRGETYDGFFSSPLQRAVQTADQIARVLSISAAVLDPRLSEQGFGEAEGMLWAAARRQFPEGVAPGAESSNDFAERTRSVVDTIATRFAGDCRRVILVSHGFAIVVLMELAGVATLPAPGEIPNGSITDFVASPGMFSLKAFAV